MFENRKIWRKQISKSSFGGRVPPPAVNKKIKNENKIREK